MKIFGDKQFKGIYSMLISVSKDLSGPVVSSALFFIDDMNENSEFAFVGIVFQGFDNL